MHAPTVGPLASADSVLVEIEVTEQPGQLELIQELLPDVSQLTDWSFLSSYLVIPTFLTIAWRFFSKSRLPGGAAVLRKTLDETINIQGVLGQILEYTQADRVLLMEFHNGDSFNSGKHFVKLSATGEVTRGNVSSYMSSVQASPLLRHAQMVNRLIDGEIHILSSADVNAAEQMDFYAFGIQTRKQVMLFFGKEARAILDIHYCWGATVPAAFEPEKLKQLNGLLMYYIQRRNSIGAFFNELIRVVTGR